MEIVTHTSMSGPQYAGIMQIAGHFLLTCEEAVLNFKVGFSFLRSITDEIT
jgi:hypothetical protein